MIEILFTCIYVFIYIFIYRSFSKHDYWAAVIFILLLLTFSPMMQYVYFPEYKQDFFLGIRQLPFKRVWLEYCHVIILLFFYKKIPGGKPNKIVIAFVFFYLVSNLFQFLNAGDFVRSLNGYVVSVVNPSIFCLIVSKTVSFLASKRRVNGIALPVQFETNQGKSIRHSSNSLKSLTESQIMQGLFRYLIIVYLLFYAISIFNFFRNGVEYDPDYEGLFIYGLGTGLGVFRERILLTVVFFFLPIIFFPSKCSIRKCLNKGEFIFFVVGTVLMLLLSNSRTMYVVVLLIVLLIAYFDPFKNRKSLLYVLIGLFCTLLITSYISSGNDIVDIIMTRFTNQGDTVLESAKEDERYEIWENARKLSADSNYLGIGFSHFTLNYTGRSGNYSNAHSLYYSVLAERGFFALVWVISVLVYIIFKSYKILKTYKSPLFTMVFLGTIGYAIVSYTGEELFNVSQVAYSLPPYFILLMLSLCSSYKVFVVMNCKRSLVPSRKKTVAE